MEYLFSSHISVCHLWPCLVPLALTIKLMLKQPSLPIHKAHRRFSSWFVWLTVFLFPPLALAACKQHFAKNPGHRWKGGLRGEEYREYTNARRVWNYTHRRQHETFSASICVLLEKVGTLQVGGSWGQQAPRASPEGEWGQIRTLYNELDFQLMKEF